MNTSVSGQTDQKKSFQRWAALLAALLGWMFDGAEMGLFGMLGRTAIKDLMHISDPAQEGVVGYWFGVIIAIFLIGAASGGVVFGWLGDRIGRVRAMSLSVLTYALFTGMCGFVTDAWQIAILRFIASLGMGGEWSLGVALVMEVWPNRSRALMAGLIGAAANLGYFAVGFIGIGLTSVLEHLKATMLSLGIPAATTEALTANQGWRIMMMLGAAPALLTFLIRLFVPESEKWEHEKGQGTTSHWATRDLLGVLIGGLGPVLIIGVWATDKIPLTLRIAATLVGLAIATIGYVYPVVRFLQRLEKEGQGGPWWPIVRRMLLAACLSGVALLGTWGSVQWASVWANLLTNSQFHSKEWTLICSSSGAVVGTILAALLGDAIGRRPTYLLMCVTSLLSSWYFFSQHTSYNTSFLVSVFVLGGCTASFYGWLPLYLPELFNTKVRATGQGFSFNFGRIIAAVGALQTGALMAFFTSDMKIVIAGQQLGTFAKGYPAACGSMSLIYIVGMVIIWLAPETKGQGLPD
ncbi:MAG: MFS transporter [Planctomycetales bacterium]